MAATVIRVENLSKQYRLGEIGTGALSHDLKRWWYQLRGKPDPFAKIGEVNDRTTKAASDYVWALQDINFEVKQGEVLGIIGKNGAGKSTLLKILSKTTTPTTGSVKIKGRIASLLEVGTGFHPELSGRENIFLNGAILGMTKREIKAKFDEIVDFSGVERYIDTPVKRYSSGMYVRLAFAVAAHLEPEILIVDEVLAVGDAEFQKKCLGKMKDVSVSEGRTVLFVSHNLQAISTIVSKSLLLNKGRVALIGNTDEVINSYLSEGKINGEVFDLRESYSNKTQIIFAQVVTSKPNQLHVWGNEFVFEVELYLDEPLKKGAFAFQVLNEYEQAIVHCWIFDNDIETFRSSGVRKLRCIIPKFRLYMGTYKFRLILAEDSGKTIIQVLENVCYFNVEMLSLQRDYEWHHGACTYLEDNYWETY